MLTAEPLLLQTMTPRLTVFSSRPGGGTGGSDRCLEWLLQLQMTFWASAFGAELRAGETLAAQTLAAQMLAAQALAAQAPVAWATQSHCCALSL